MRVYERNVKYYETDKMGIVHHSNYIRWMEEARLDAMEQIGYGFDKMEASGIISPVVEVSGKYKNMSYFNENVLIYVFLKEIGKVKFTLEYRIVGAKNDEVKFIGESVHCFLNAYGKPIVIPREMPEFAKALESLTETK